MNVGVDIEKRKQRKEECHRTSKGYKRRKGDDDRQQRRRRIAPPQTVYKRNRKKRNNFVYFAHSLHCLVWRRNLMDLVDCVCQPRVCTHCALCIDKDNRAFSFAVSPLSFFASFNVCACDEFFFLPLSLFCSCFQRCTNIIHLFLCRRFLLFPFIMIIRDALGVVTPRWNTLKSPRTLYTLMCIPVVWASTC